MAVLDRLVVNHGKAFLASMQFAAFALVALHAAIHQRANAHAVANFEVLHISPTQQTTPVISLPGTMG